MSKPDSSALVGAHVTLELTSDATVSGTVFTYDEKNCTIVVLQQPNADRPNVKIINTCYVKRFVVNAREPTDPALRLPRGVAPEATLPAMAGAESLGKRLNKTLFKAEERRRYPTNVPLTIAACHLFDRLTLSCGDVSFTSEPHHLAQAVALAKAGGVAAGKPAVAMLVGESVLVTDNGGAAGVSWENPVIGEAKPGIDQQQLARVKNAAASAFKSQ